VLHLVFLAAHAASAVAAFVLGLLRLRPRTAGVSTIFRWYLGALWLMVLFLIVVVGIDWTRLDLTTRSIYGALTLFALYIGWRGWRALQNLRSRRPGWEDEYIDNVGFTLIALFDGFVIVLAIDLGAPIWLVLLVAALGVVVGRLGVARVKRSVAV
jgi:hypothetical protein